MKLTADHLRSLIQQEAQKIIQEQFVVDMSAEDLRFPIQDLISRKVLVKASRKPKKEDVKVLQQALVKAGFSPGNVVGDLDRETYIAVGKFQKSVGLKPDRIAGPNTFMRLADAIEKAPAGPAVGGPEPAPSGTAEPADDSMVTRRGYDLRKGPLDRSKRKTRKAIGPQSARAIVDEEGAREEIIANVTRMVGRGPGFPFRSARRLGYLLSTLEDKELKRQLRALIDGGERAISSLKTRNKKMGKEIMADINRRVGTFPDETQPAARRELIKRLVRKMKAGSNKIGVDLDLDVFKV